MRFKKIFAAISALAVMSVGSVSNVAAVAPTSYDINGDGLVNSADAVSISTALAGQWQPTDISTLDANQNGVVDDLDRLSVVWYVSMIGNPTITMQ